MFNLKFQESSDLSISKIIYDAIYFLIKNDEVVYVGQTTKGLARPFQHVDKIFDRVEIISVRIEDLNKAEGYFISKYKPKYNFVIPCYYSMLRAREEIRISTNNASFSILDLKRVISKHKIDVVSLKGKEYISPKSIKKIISILRGDNI